MPSKLFGVAGLKGIDINLDEVGNSYYNSMPLYKDLPLYDYVSKNLILLSLSRNERFQIASKNNVILIFDGIIFNKDKEVDEADYLINSYLSKGIQFVRELNGFFLIFIIDGEEFFILNDKFGSRPLYYYFNGVNLFFSSEIKSMLNFIPKDINWKAWSDRFMYRFVLGNDTFFKDVFSLSNASIFSISNDGLKTESYWDYDEVLIDDGLSLLQIIEGGVEKIKTAILRQSAGLNECICFLSGGYDSRCIVSSFKKFTSTKIKAFTTEHPAGIGDIVYSKKVADKLGIEHRVSLHPRDIYSLYFLKKIYLLDGMVEENLWLLPLIDKIDGINLINFDGLAGDVLLKGLFLDNYNLKNFENDKILYKILSNQIGYDVTYLKKYFGKEIFYMLKYNNSILKELENIPKTPNRITIFFLKNRTKNAVSLAPNNITSEKLDSYFPFLDIDLVEFSLKIHPDHKINKHIYSLILKELDSEIMEVPSTNDLDIRKIIFRYLESLLTRLNLYKKVKSFIKFNLINPLKSEKDSEFMKRLCKDILEYPSFINKNRIVYEIGKGKFNYGILSVIEFLVWYNFFVIENDKLKNYWVM